MNASSLIDRAGFLQRAKFVLCALLVSAWAPFAVAAQNPYTMIEGVSEDLLEVVRANAQYLNSDPQRYYSAVDGVLDPVVDFNFITRGVMHRYAKQATAEQRSRFARAFRRDLVATFARGVANFGDMEVKVVRPDSEFDPKQRRVNVLQEVHSQEGVSKIAYSLVRARSGEWKLINVTLNGINLGKTFRGQFTQAMQTHKDIDKVIANWSATKDAADKAS